MARARSRRQRGLWPIPSGRACREPRPIGREGRGPTAEALGVAILPSVLRQVGRGIDWRRELPNSSLERTGARVRSPRSLCGAFADREYARRVGLGRWERL